MKTCDSCGFRFSNELQIWRYRRYELCEDCYRRIKAKESNEEPTGIWRLFKDVESKDLKESMSKERYKQFDEFETLLDKMCNTIPGSKEYCKYNLRLWLNLKQPKKV